MKTLFNFIKYKITGKHKCMFYANDVIDLKKDPECYFCSKKLSEFYPKTK